MESGIMASVDQVDGPRQHLFCSDLFQRVTGGGYLYVMFSGVHFYECCWEFFLSLGSRYNISDLQIKIISWELNS